MAAGRQHLTTNDGNGQKEKEDNWVERNGGGRPTNNGHKGNNGKKKTDLRENGMESWGRRKPRRKKGEDG